MFTYSQSHTDGRQAIKFYCVPYGEKVPAEEFPYVVLWDDDWDDYHFKTTFNVEIYLDHKDVANIGEAKFLSTDLPEIGGRTVLPREFTTLPGFYCSLGQSYTYYETLKSLGEGIYLPFLAAVGDVIHSSKRYEEFKDRPGFKKSLLRSSGARRTLEDAPKLFFWHSGASGLTEFLFRYETHVGGSTFVSEFSFGDQKHVPSRINAVIGYNGVGKTTLLANLAQVSSADQEAQGDPEFQKRYGRFDGDVPVFGATIAVSYSAFDTFDLPTDARNDQSGELLGYTYCGLRKVAEDSRASPPTDNKERHIQLKDSQEITGDFFRALKLAQSEARQEILQSALAALTLEPSFSRVDTSGFSQESDDFSQLRKHLLGFSTGHKIVFNIVVQLVAHLQVRSLVLIDEPESHLHPPLLAALLRSVNIALEHRDSVAIVATHSPVVLQEVPRRYVRVLRRFGDLTRVDTPESETFGENVGYLTRTVFNLDSSQTDYHRVLNTLAERFSLDQIEAMFDGAMSAQARAYVIGQQRRRA